MLYPKCAVSLSKTLTVTLQCSKHFLPLCTYIFSEIKKSFQNHKANYYVSQTSWKWDVDMVVWRFLKTNLGDFIDMKLNIEHTTNITPISLRYITVKA